MAIDSAVNALLTNKLAEATKKLEIVQAEIADGVVDTGGFVGLVLRGRHEFSYWCSTSDRFEDAKVQQPAWQRFKEEQQCAEAAEAAVAAENEAGDPAVLSAAVVGAGLSARPAPATLPSFLTNTDRVARDWRAYLEALADVRPHESSAETPLWFTALFPEAAPHMPPTRPSPPVPAALAARQERAWERLGGREIEDMVGRGAVALLDAHWVLAHASRGGRLRRRQEMPPEAFITLAELRAAGCPEGTLPILACTHAWQGADEPDADGSQQRLLVNFLKAATALTPECVGNSLAASLGPAGTQRWGLFVPFSSMHQRARPDEEHAAEDALFHEALMGVDRWYVHAHTLVLRLAHLGAHYGASMTPPGSNLARYAKVGGAVVGHLAFGADTFSRFCARLHAAWSPHHDDENDLLIDQYGAVNNSATGWSTRCHRRKDLNYYDLNRRFPAIDEDCVLTFDTHHHHTLGPAHDDTHHHHTNALGPAHEPSLEAIPR
eukprot:jgi/Chrpa1/27022/Chrysochromulina_OHIO_Genome00000954-RA